MGAAHPHFTFEKTIYDNSQENIQCAEEFNDIIQELYTQVYPGQ